MLAQLDSYELDGPLLLEQTCHLDDKGHDGLQLGETLVCSDANGFVNVLLNNPTGTTHKIEKGTLLGLAYEAELVESTSDTPAPLELEDGEPTSQTHSHCHALPVYSVHAATVECRKQNLVQSIAEAGVGLP